MSHHHRPLRFLLHISQAYGIPIGAPLERALLAAGHEVCWYCEHSELASRLPDPTRALLQPQAVIDWRPDVVLSATNSVPDFFPGAKVQIFHGFSVDKRSADKGHFRLRGFFDLYCTQGPSTTEPFQALAREHGYFEVVETGWSKVDPLFPVRATANAKPRILLATTFTPRLSLAHDDAFLTELARLIARGDREWTLVHHPLLDPARVARLRALVAPNARYLDTVDLIPLMREADLLIADTTSAIVEFMVQGKPVVTFRNNKPGPHLLDVRAPHELAAALDTALAPPAELTQAIDEFVARTHPYADGRSSERVIAACSAFLQNDKSHLKRKPLNLWRKWQVRRDYGFYTLKSFDTPPTLGVD